jgi:hypothetical protein
VLSTEPGGLLSLTVSATENVKLSNDAITLYVYAPGVPLQVSGTNMAPLDKRLVDGLNKTGLIFVVIPLAEVSFEAVTFMTLKITVSSLPKPGYWYDWNPFDSL